MILKALALYAVRDTTPADIAMTKSLTLAEPEGYVRVFLDEGPPMQRLLTQWMSHADASPARDYAIHLLSQFNTEPHEGTAVPEKASPVSDLVEPLTPRELDVLRLLAQGLSNRQIAEKLILSEGTVKFYVHAVMEKLGVHNRTQAILTARELNLI
jgi:LuxR family maltose regulon positive regulatory protein